ncbi:uncharacterized protein LOC134831884 [Culicoides brevitarsis]|uniref:uncharacterized protein LOC134831884 n=1 Tax=Culicoides brevitarsis TaxID=469753 RepID=UPI00307B8051
MAPFKLKFRMGGSRSTSSEHEGDVAVNHPTATGGGGNGSLTISNATNTTNQGSQSVINSTTSLIHFGSTSTIDSDHNTDSLVSLGNNDQRALLQNCGQTSTDSIGYINPSLTHTETTTITTSNTTAQSIGKSKSTTTTANNAKQIPSTPPPSYEHVLEENRLAALDKENNQTFLLHTLMQNSHVKMSNQQLSHDDGSLDQDMDEELCTDSNCEQNYENYENQHKNGDEQSSLVGGGNNECNLMVDTESIHLSDIDCQSYHDNSYGTYASSDHHQLQDMEEPQYEPATPQQKPGKEIIYKSSKEMYKAVAKECGITCKMSDQCRCYDCQSRYFDCEYEQNEHEKTDGGLGAGTPLYISEVMHGTACTIL